jgi:hypothetical protein
MKGNTMAIQWPREKGQTMIYKHHTENERLNSTDTTKQWG